jgi:hypothetical protein
MHLAPLLGCLASLATWYRDNGFSRILNLLPKSLRVSTLGLDFAVLFGAYNCGGRPLSLLIDIIGTFRADFWLSDPLISNGPIFRVAGGQLGAKGSRAGRLLSADKSEKAKSFHFQIEGLLGDRIRATLLLKLATHLPQASKRYQLDREDE